MPPKRVSSRGKSPKVKAKAKAAASAATSSSAASSAAPTKSTDALEQEAEELFEQFQPEGDKAGVIKLAQFAEIVRSMNVRKCMLWGDDPASIIKREWSAAGGFSSRELTLAQMKAWWPKFTEATNEEVRNKESAAKAKEDEKAAKYGGSGVWHVKLTELQESLMQARLKGKTPLIIDNTPQHRVEVYFSYSEAHIIECKKMIMDKVKGTPLSEILEEEARRMVSAARCFKLGRTVLFRMANTACDLQMMFNSPTFPSRAMLDRVALDDLCGEENVGKVADSPFAKMASCDDERLEFEAYGIHKDFQVVLLTHFTEEEYEHYLKEAIPLHLMQPIAPQVEG